MSYTVLPFCTETVKIVATYDVTEKAIMHDHLTVADWLRSQGIITVRVRRERAWFTRLDHGQRSIR